MARRCEICGKSAQVGFKISHSHRKTKTRWLPNIQRVKAIVDGQVKHIHVCTSCLKSGRVQKAVK